MKILRLSPPLLIWLIVSPVVAFADPDCRKYFNPFELELPKAYGPRGFFNATIPSSPENTISASAVGAEEWGVKIYPKDTLDDAFEHLVNEPKYKDHLMNPFYMIHPKKKNPQSFFADAKKENKDQETFQRMIQEGAKVYHLQKSSISRRRIDQFLADLKTKIMEDAEEIAPMKAFIKMEKDREKVRPVQRKMNPIESRLIKNRGLAETIEIFLAGTPSSIFDARQIPIEISNALPPSREEDKWVEAPAAFFDLLPTVTIDLESEKDGYMFYQRGWAAPEIHGLADLRKFVALASVRKLRELGRTLVNNGYKFQFNSRLDDGQPAIIELIRRAGDQTRKTKTEIGDSRFSKGLDLVYADLQSQGKAYSVEVYHPCGGLVGGVFGNIVGLPRAESIYYPFRTNPEIEVLAEKCGKEQADYVSRKALDLAKLAIIALADRLVEAGHQWFDTGMVTEFTRNTLHGTYYWREDFERTRDEHAQIPKRAIRFDDWKPLSP